MSMWADLKEKAPTAKLLYNAWADWLDGGARSCAAVHSHIVRYARRSR